MAGYRVISADSHVREPENLWLDYIAPAYRERAPRVVHEEAKDSWWCDGLPPLPARVTIMPGDAEEQRHPKVRYAENRPGGWDPHARIQDMAIDGVDAEILYSTVAMDFYQLTDIPYANACFHAYNRWLADYCAAHPERLKGIGNTTVEDVEAALEELRYVRKAGLSGISIGIQIDEDLDYDHPRYDPFWALAEELDLPVSFHILTGKRPTFTSRVMVDYAGFPSWIQKTIGTMIFGKVFERFPKLTVVSVECDAGWIGTWLERADHVYTRSRTMNNVALQQLPSETLKRNVKATFMRDRSAIRLRDQIGLETIMWSSDYPHGDSTWPDSRRVIEQTMFDVPEDEKHQILAGTAARLYRMP
jgi:predicted TIM-barrel fold metal-dependent hydrolase